MSAPSYRSVEQMAGLGQNLNKWSLKILVIYGSEMQFIIFIDIRWIDDAGDYMCICDNDTTHFMRIMVKKRQELLNPDIFIRVHRSTIVNAKNITAAQTLNNGEYLLTLKCDAQVKVSRSYRDKVKAALAK